MDMMMPDMDGLTACKEIRKEKDISVLILSAKGMEYDKRFVFEVGIDDYVVKPFSPKELMARVNVIVSHHRPQSGTSARRTLEAGALTIDVSGRTVIVDGQRVNLTAKEYGLLLYFVENQGMVLTREKILNTVWDYSYQGADRIVDWQIKLLRNKLGICWDCIKMQGVGYKLRLNTKSFDVKLWAYFALFATGIFPSSGFARQFFCKPFPTVRLFRTYKLRRSELPSRQSG